MVRDRKGAFVRPQRQTPSFPNTNARTRENADGSVYIIYALSISNTEKIVYKNLLIKKSLNINISLVGRQSCNRNSTELKKKKNQNSFFHFSPLQTEQESTA